MVSSLRCKSCERGVRIRNAAHDKVRVHNVTNEETHRVSGDVAQALVTQHDGPGRRA